jgi:hypothetical protein
MTDHRHDYDLCPQRISNILVMHPGEIMVDYASLMEAAVTITKRRKSCLVTTLNVYNAYIRNLGKHYTCLHKFESCLGFYVLRRQVVLNRRWLEGRCVDDFVHSFEWQSNIKLEKCR